MNEMRGESARHRELKRLALGWAQAHGFNAAGVEVRLPRSGFRADVAACVAPAGLGVSPGETAVFECKQARADLLRDTADERTTLERLRTISARRAELERLIGAHLPDLRRGETLFAECDTCDLDAIRHDGLRAVRREEAQLQGRLFERTKFARIHRYRCADRLYLVVMSGVLEPHEAPAGWGLLVATHDGTLELVRRPERIDSGAAARLTLLRAIAMAGTRLANAAFGLPWDEIDTQRRRILPQ